jgi:hypothetical protein
MVVTDDTGDRNLYLIAQVAAARSGSLATGH